MYLKPNFPSPRALRSADKCTRRLPSSTVTSGHTLAISAFLLTISPGRSTSVTRISNALAPSGITSSAFLRVRSAMFSSNGPNRTVVTPGESRWSAGIAASANPPDARLAVRPAQCAPFQIQCQAKPYQPKPASTSVCLTLRRHASRRLDHFPGENEIRSSEAFRETVVNGPNQIASSLDLAVSDPDPRELQ